MSVTILHTAKPTVQSKSRGWRARIWLGEYAHHAAKDANTMNSGVKRESATHVELLSRSALPSVARSAAPSLYARKLLDPDN